MTARPTVAELLNLTTPGGPANDANFAKARVDEGLTPDIERREGPRKDAKGGTADRASRSHGIAEVRGSQDRTSVRDCQPSSLDSPVSQGSSAATAPSELGALGLGASAAADAHAQPWSDHAIEMFMQRSDSLMRRGFLNVDADAIAERLHLRDIQVDDRRYCLECRYLKGHALSGWRCANAAVADVGPDLPRVLVMQLQRCPGMSVMDSLVPRLRARNDQSPTS